MSGVEVPRDRLQQWLDVVTEMADTLEEIDIDQWNSDGFRAWGRLLTVRDAMRKMLATDTP